MSTQDIIDIEEQNEDSIFLYKEGIFWKAYQQSAFLVVTHFRPDFKIKIRDMKCVAQKVYSVGFPASALSSVFGETPIDELDDKRIRIHIGAVDYEAYNQWKMSASEKAEVKILSDYDYSGEEDSAVGSNVLRKLKDFNVSASTPVECMMLVCELQKMLH